MISGSITGLGAILSLFLDRDGGTRGGGIKLQEKDEPTISLSRRLINRITSCFVRHRTTIPRPAQAREERDQLPTPSATMEIRRDERNPLSLGGRFATKQSGYGSAYGYNNSIPSRTPRIGSVYGFSSRGGRGRGGMRSISAATSTRYAPDYDDIEHQDLNFAQR
jgi:hypothetical protein